MRTRFLPFAAALLIQCGTVLSQTGGLNAPQPVAPFLNGVFPATSPGEATGWTTVNAFPNLTFVDPIWLTPYPGTNNLVVAGKNGEIWLFNNNPNVAAATRILDLRTKVQTEGDQGLYCLVFHPQFGQAGSPNRGYIYISYNHRPALAGAGPDASYQRLSRFTIPDGSNIPDAASEQVLIHQYDPQSWHNGGAMLFGPDGFLYLTNGDGGNSNDSYNNSQRIDFGLFSGVLRIDVDRDPARSHPIRRQPQDAGRPAGWPVSFTANYYIPNDNPWLDPAGTILEEFYTVGLRSPHAMHRDAVTGDIWLGDVGQGTQEEISLVVRGGNNQWAFREGAVAGPKARPAVLIGTEQPPVHSYGRGVGSCVIGGLVYRGPEFATALGGKYLFGDHVAGVIWAMTYTPGQPPQITTLCNFPTGNKAGLANFCEDASGNVYLMNLAGTNVAGGTIRKLANTGLSPEPPALLSQTGAFSNLATLAPAAGLLPYDIGSPLWSDGAEKWRWIALPNDGSHNTAAEKIVFSEKGNWVFPAGTVFVKHFELPIDEGNPLLAKRLETRFLIATARGGHYGVTYRWNATGTEATLLQTGESAIISIATSGGGTRMQQWDFPSRNDCLRCHNLASGQALGVRTAPLDHDYFYPPTGRTANQLRTWNALGMFDRTLNSTEIDNFMASRALTDTAAPLEHRVRSYLDSNCSHCHRPGGAFDGFDARLGTPLSTQNLINGLLTGNFSSNPNHRYLRPGDLANSIVHLRASQAGPNNGVAMPPLAKNKVDDTAVQALAAYIGSITEAEFDSTYTVARYVRLIGDSEMFGNPWTTIAELTILRGSGQPIPQSDYIVTVDAEEPDGLGIYAVDGNPDTLWHTSWRDSDPPHPHTFTVDLGELTTVGGFRYLPRQDMANGRIKDWRFQISTDGVTWTQAGAGQFTDGTDLKIFDTLVGGIRPARASLAGPSGTVGGEFEVTLTFDFDVTGMTAGDFAVTNGALTGLRGSGHYYVAKVRPVASPVTVSLPANRVTASNGAGNNASIILNLPFLDVSGPVPGFTQLPPGSIVSGAFTIGVDFGETVVGLTAADFQITNGTLTSLGGNGSLFALGIAPLAPGPVVVTVRAGAVADLLGNAMGPAVSASFLNQSNVYLVEAENGALGGGFVIANSANASGGKYIVFPDGTGGGVEFVDARRADYSLSVPEAGDYRLVGRVNSPDNSADSFFVRMDGAPATPYLWDTPVTGGFVVDYVNNRGGADPVIFPLTVGPHVASIYERDDGTQLDWIALEPVNPIVRLSTAAGAVSGDFTVSIFFTQNVTGLAAADFSIAGGNVTSLAGSGASYTLTVHPTTSPVIISLPADAAADALGGGNRPSNTVLVPFNDPALRNISISSVSVPENAGTAAVIVSLNAPAVAGVSASFITLNGTAASPGDFVGSSGSVTIPAGQQQTIVNVPIVNDSIREANESFTVELHTPVNAQIASATAVVTIQNDDTLFDEWAGANGLAGATPGGDIDGDGLLDALEFAFNLNPHSGHAPPWIPGTNTGLPSASLVLVNEEPTFFDLHYLRRRAATNPGITYRAHIAHNLADWQPWTGAETVTTIDATWESVRIRVPLAPGNPRCFGRVEIQMP